MGLYNNFTKARDKLFKTFSDFTEATALIQDQKSGGGYDPVTQTIAPVTYGISIVDTVILKDYMQDEIAGEVIAGDTKIIVQCKNITEEIQPNAIVTIGSDIYTVVGVTPKPKTNFVVQELHCRGKNDA